MSRLALTLVAAALQLQGHAHAQDLCANLDRLSGPVSALETISGYFRLSDQVLAARRIVFEDNATLAFNNDALQDALIVAGEIVVGRNVTITSYTDTDLDGMDVWDAAAGLDGNMTHVDGGPGADGVEGDPGQSLDRLSIVVATKGLSMADHLIVDLSGFPGGDGGVGGPGGAGGDGYQGRDSVSTTDGECQYPARRAGNGGDGATGGTGGAAGKGGDGGTLSLVGPADLDLAVSSIILDVGGGPAGQPGAGGDWGLGGDAGTEPKLTPGCTVVPRAAEAGSPTADNWPGKAPSGAAATDGEPGDSVRKVCP